MTASYWWRLAWLSLASFCLIHLTLATAVTLFAPHAIRLAGRLRAQQAARFLFALRLLPATLSIFIVAVVCIPSYFSFEPESAYEQVGPVCVLAAALAAWLWTASIGRALRAAGETFRHMRRWHREGHFELLAGWPAWVIESKVPFLALAGVLRPRLIASRGLLTALSADQLASALHHEQAHLASRDNLKRLIMRSLPGILPFISGFDAIERSWAKFAEQSADESSVAGDPQRALLLADTLVLVARGGATKRSLPLATLLLADGTELRARVDRLLQPAPPSGNSAWPFPLSVGCAAAFLAAILLQPFALRLAHELLEDLLH